ncbi:MAG: hypothetical protein P8X98_09260, partial [Woeseiaceae bacterium]
NGDYFGSYHDAEVAYREMARFSRHDADMYKTYRADTMRQCRFIRDFLLSTAPDPTSFRPRDLREMLHIGSRFQEMGEDRMYETIRFWTMSVAARARMRMLARTRSVWSQPWARFTLASRSPRAQASSQSRR